MKQYNAKNILNIAIAGHSGSGKTSLAEAIPVVVRNASARYLRVIPYLTATLKKLREKALL